MVAYGRSYCILLKSQQFIMHRPFQCTNISEVVSMGGRCNFVLTPSSPTIPRRVVSRPIRPLLDTREARLIPDCRELALTDEGAVFSSSLFDSSPASWKCFPSTVFPTSSRPFSVAFPMHVIGVNRLMYLILLMPGFETISSQILWTKSTGSIGGCVLKNRTHGRSRRTGENSCCLACLLLMDSISLWIEDSISSTEPSSSPFPSDPGPMP
jgi:hypothetical protein